MTDRKQLEYDIIGACILEGKYGHIVHILRAKNFATPECKIIWQVMGQLWPDHTINSHLMHRKLSHSPKLTFSWAWYIANMTAPIVQTYDLVQNAFLLLELDFRARFDHLLNSYRMTAPLPVKSIIDEILTEANQPESDIFVEIDMSIIHLKANAIDDLAADLQEMGEQINTRAKAIRLIDRKETLLRELKNIENQILEVEQIMNQRNQQAA